jgi:uridine kinase
MQFTGTRHRAYGEPKGKRHLYLTETAYAHLVGLATCSGSSPSEVCEQIVRNHMHALAIPSDDLYQHDTAGPEETNRVPSSSSTSL